MIDSHISKTIDIFNNNFTYHIPDFQRDFVWGGEEVRQLFEDFSEDTNNFKNEIKDSDGYLLGNIVLINDQNSVDTKIVIDGQQRLTTLSLIYKALEKILGEKRNFSNFDESIKWAQKSGDLAKGYGIFNDTDSFEALKIEHHPSLNFGSSYSSIIRGDSEIEAQSNNPSDLKINEVYETIEEEIRSLSEAQLSKFVSYIKSKVLLIVTTAPDLSKAFQLFEILNNRGRGLDPIDLIKNSLLKFLADPSLLEVQRNEFNTHWKSFIKNLKISDNRNIDSSTFLKHYLIGTKGLNVSKDKLFSTFSNPSQKYTVSEVLTLVKSLNKLSEIYGDIESKKYKFFIENSTQMYILFELLGLKQAHSLLMPFYFETKEMKEEAVDLAIRLGASVIFSYTQTNFIEANAPTLIEKYYKVKQEKNSNIAFKNFKNDMEKLIFERSSIAKESITLRKFEDRKGQANKKGLDLFKFIELYAHGDTQILNPAQGKKISLEHIMPRDPSHSNFNNTHFNSEAERREYLNRIGNFAILYNSDNAHLSNKSFFEKMPVYSNLGFLSTKVLGSKLTTHIINGHDAQLYKKINDFIYIDNIEGKPFMHWTKELIDIRSARIANYLMHILNKNPVAISSKTQRSTKIFDSNGENEEIDQKPIKGNTLEFEPKAAFHKLCVRKISRKLATNFNHKSRSFYISSNEKYHIVCVVSKKYPRKDSLRYWYAFHPSYIDFFEGAKEPYLLFGCGSEDNIIFIPYEIFSKYLYGLRETVNETRRYWHVEIIQKENKFYLYLSKTKENIDITNYLM